MLSFLWFCVEFPTQAQEVMKAKNLGKTINSYADEIAPRISPDGKTLYFTREFHSENIGGKDGGQDIWFSNLDKNGKWEKAQNIGFPLNTEGPNSICTITPDGNSALVINQYNHNTGKLKGGGASITTKNAQGVWETPKPITIQNYVNNNRLASFFMSNDGTKLFLACENPNGFGGLDLYISFKEQENIWGTPINLGAHINTPQNESSLFLAADNQTLYFASDGHPGFGESDIFMTRRLDDTWKNWSKPINLGPVFNSSGKDGYFSIAASGKEAYFVSTTNAIGGKDIFVVTLTDTLRPKAVALIEGKISDPTGKPIQAIIYYQGIKHPDEKGIAKSNNQGTYKLTLPVGDEYQITSSTAPNNEVKSKIDLRNQTEYKEINLDLKLQNKKEEKPNVAFPHIFFETNQTSFSPEAISELNRVVETLNAFPDIKIEISGHTDSQGNDIINMPLSQKRADQVKAYLIEKGIKKERLSSKGYGSTNPIDDNQQEAGRAMNRRVSFKQL